MKRLLLVVLLATGCATAPVPKMSLEEAGLAPAPARQLQRLVHARLPRFRLREMTLGLGLDYMLRDNGGPTSSGQVLCSTSTSVIQWQDPATCNLATGTNYFLKTTNLINGAGGEFLLTDTTDETRYYGWSNYPASSTNVLRYRFGDNGTGMQTGSNDQLEIFAYHGVLIAGGRASTTAPAAVTGGGTGDYSLEVAASTTGSLKVDGAALFSGNITATAGTNSITTSTLKMGSSGSNVVASYSGTGTTAVSPSTVAANSTVCGTAPGVTIAVTGVGAAKPCFVGAPSNNNLIPWCRTTAGNFLLCFTNPTTAALAPAGNASYVMRDLE